MSFRIAGRVTLNGRGRSGVAVSNGERVVRTGRDGRYRISVDPGRHRSVFVVVPDGAKSTGPFYRAIGERSGPSDGMDFPLEGSRDRAPRTLVFGQVTDLHVQTTGGIPPSPARLRADLLALTSRESLCFLVVTGDLTNLGDLPSLRRYRQIASDLPCPVFSMFGGHDGLAEQRREGRPEDAPATRNYESVLGPLYYSFDWGGRHFIVWPNEDRFFSPPERKSKTRWLTEDLRAHTGRDTILFTHVPPTVDFVDRLAGAGVVGIFHGHWHSSKAHLRRGIPVFATSCFPFGGIDTTPRCFRRVQFQGRRMRTRIVPVGASSRLESSSEPRRRKGRTLRLLWSVQLDTPVHRAAPVLVGDRVLVSICDEDLENRQGVLCLDACTGGPRWRAATDASVKNAVAVADGRVVAVSVTGRIHALDFDTGTTCWQTDLRGHPDRWIYTSPAIAGGLVYAGGKGGYGAFDLKTGTPRWYTRPASTGSDAWSCFAGPIVADNLLILLLQRAGMVALDCTTGLEAWRLDLPVEYMDPKPVLAAGRVFTCGKPGELTAIQGTSGEVLWRRKITPGQHLSGLGADLDTVYATALSGEVMAYGFGGRRKWTFRVSPDRLDMSPYRRSARVVTGGPISFGNRLALGANDGQFRLLDRSTGRETERWDFGHPVSAPPAASEGRLVVASYGGRVACFET